MNNVARNRELVVIIENPHSVIKFNDLVQNVIRLGATRIYIVDNRKPLSDDWKTFYLEQSDLKASNPDFVTNLSRRFDSSEECLKELVDNSFVSVGTTTAESSKHFYHVDEINYASIPKLAIWFGNESEGLSEFAFKKCDYIVTVPTVGFIDIINIATMISHVLYEVSRQIRKTN